MVGVLYYINCECEHMYLIGINGKDIRKSPVDNQELFAIGQDELDAIDKKICKGDKIPCPGCGKECKVKQSGGVFDD